MSKRFVLKKPRAKAASRHSKQGPITVRTGRASPHGDLVNDVVHVFVDDQNLFYGITNDRYGRGFRIDFGRLLLAAARASDGRTRLVGSAYIAGVIPDDDSFWAIAASRGFEVRRGRLGRRRSKQDDAYLVRDMTLTVSEKPGPSTIVLIAGDEDYVPPLELSRDRHWRNEVVFIDHGVSFHLEPVVHEFRTLAPNEIQHMPDVA